MVKQESRTARILGRVFKPEDGYVWEKDDLLDVIFWGRVLLSLAAGVVYGALPLTGFLPFAGFIGVMVFLTMAWWRSHSVDEDDYGGMGPLVNEGLHGSIALFTLTWIITYSLLQF